MFAWALIAQTLLAAILGLYCGIEPVTMVEQFSTKSRYTGVAVGYNVTLAVFGGTTPLICTWLVQKHGPLAPALYLISIAVVSSIAVCFLRIPKQPIPDTMPLTDRGSTCEAELD